MTKVHDVLTDILGTVAKLTMSPSDTDELTLPKVVVFYLFLFSCFVFIGIFAFWHQNRQPEFFFSLSPNLYHKPEKIQVTN